MKYRDPVPVLQRLLVVTSATRDAFLEASRASRSPRLSALFLRRAEHQGSIADYLSEYLTPGSGSESVRSPAGQRSTTYTFPLPITRPSHDHEALLRACVRVLDVAILEFAKAYTPSLSLAQRITLERHHDQMRWSREELQALRLSNTSSPTPDGDAAPEAAEHGEGDDVWFGTLPPPTRGEG